ncbi:hypothetical protein TST_0716 [Thermosulfidibacter takaii ABI70S6]|uniref:DUF507 family protein n=1 Tax=Thermosulfidibacter takaii (strain DSM 17441 / JCM 13301 / NBRC 103674 / ABI70S6) TaxID=1298851 RepID=A0A0S3QTA7_THET7|nr:DUF507 family protein [Thermosulfidibacter takaii]BAT71521.1 hypothetical protein TST_0716 [Thermosulfidibacter takaii ABI70S6]
MMSRERMFYLAEKISDELKKSGIKIKDSRKLRSVIINTLTEEVRFFETLDREARDRISKMSKPVAEGSGEWLALYERYFEEAFRKRVRI